MMKLVILFLLSFINIICFAQKTFTNPLLPSGADPYSFYKDGYYYYTNSLGNRIDIWKTKNMVDLKSAERKTIYQPEAGTMHSKDLWAPEIISLQNKWYAYFAADDGNNNHHRLYVLENDNANPMQGEWIFKGKLADSSDKWAIDADVFQYKNQLYIAWSGWQDDENGEQDIFIAKMKNPLTIESKRVRISAPKYDWETKGDLHDANNPPHINVNEGPQFLEHDGKLFIIYSASGCWTDAYTLGMLSLQGIICWIHLYGKNLRNLFLNHQLETTFMRRGIILFLNHQMEKKTGFYIMRMINLAKVAAYIVRQEHKNFHGIKMEHLILANR